MLSIQQVISDAQDLCNDGKEHTAIDIILECLDDHFLAFKFNEINEFLPQIDPTKYNSLLILSIVNFTMSAKKHLSNRMSFVDKSISYFESLVSSGDMSLRTIERLKKRNKL